MDESSQEQPSIPNEYEARRDELTGFLRTRLIECGWRDQVATMCREIIQNRGVDNVKFAHLISEVKEEARVKVPANVRAEILAKLRQSQ